MNRPSPSAIWVLIDEDYRSINDAAVAVTMVSSSFLDAPASYHGGACGLAFGDGHTVVQGDTHSAVTFSPINRDVTWVQECSSAPVQ
jgi:prepilin-type processing-associated H-X9-DG protein